MPDRQYLQDLAGDSVVDVIARSTHEHATHARKVVVVRVGRAPKRWRTRNKRHNLLELLPEQVWGGATVDLPQRSMAAASSAARV
jgi:hypothetical protein